MKIQLIGLREISEDTRQEDAASSGEQQFGQKENPVFGDEQRSDEQREKKEQEFEEENPEEEVEDAVIISYLIYTAIAMYIDKIDKLYVDKLSMYYNYRM